MALACLVAIAAPLALWGSLQLGADPLSGLRVEGHELAKARSVERSLEERAMQWQESEVEVQVEGSLGTSRASRAALGVTLPVASMATLIRAVGRSGNPVLDLGKWWEARRGRLNLRWQPRLDQARLASFVEREQRRAEEPPIAGVSDGHGYSLPGRDGRALDVSTALAALSKALASGKTSVLLPVNRVPAPPPIALGSPDGALFEQEAGSEPVVDVGEVVHAGPVPEPAAWLPANSDDCYHAPPQRPFCDGPRKVPMPFGDAQQLAAALRLGELETVGHLIRQGPRPEWVRAAGGPSAEPEASWPVPSGKLGRGFGYVRREELKDRIHAGLDIVAPRGSLIVASRTGVVAYSDNRVRGYGNLLVIVHANGDVTLSAHCQRIFVFAGERVARGQVVAEVGMTGLALGPHLHFELRVSGEPSDPAPLFAEAGAARKQSKAF
jgi:murein DD-endopeptidase MepM/ murein hydrolase activator NlpD